MDKIIELAGVLKPSDYAKRMRIGDVSEGATATVIGTRVVLGRTVTFYSSGEHRLDKTGLTEEEEYGSQLLRFCHASLIAGEPIGDKRTLWVDATKDPVEIFLQGIEASVYLRQLNRTVSIGSIPVDMITDDDDTLIGLIKEHGQSFQLPRSPADRSHISDS